MFRLFWQRLSFRPMTLGAAALGCAATIYAIGASGCCGPNDAIIRGCIDAGAADAGDEGTGGAAPDSDDCL